MGLTCCRYLESLLAYLEGYTQRVKPLLDLNEEMSKVLLAFDDKWTEGAFPGWPVSGLRALSPDGRYVDRGCFSRLAVWYCSELPMLSCCILYVTLGIE